jgi:hypothetical protein
LPRLLRTQAIERSERQHVYQARLGGIGGDHKCAGAEAVGPHAIAESADRQTLDDGQTKTCDERQEGTHHGKHDDECGQVYRPLAGS